VHGPAHEPARPSGRARPSLCEAGRRANMNQDEKELLAEPKCAPTGLQTARRRSGPAAQVPEGVFCAEPANHPSGTRLTVPLRPRHVYGSVSSTMHILQWRHCP
jgi:hypothetical protein